MYIPRYRMTNNFGEYSPNGAWVKYDDHVAAMQAVLPQPKFKVGDRVTHWDGSIGVVKFVNLFEHGTSFDVQWHTPIEIGGTHPGKNLTLYVAPIPDSKFKIGDRVLLDKQPEVLVVTGIRDSQSVASDWSYDVCTTTGMPVTRVSSSHLDLYVPPVTTCGCPSGYVKKATAPTLDELIPTLKEHEWVRGTYKGTGIAFGPCTVYFNEIGAMFAGDNQLIHWNDGTITHELATIERCDDPNKEVK